MVRDNWPDYLKAVGLDFGIALGAYLIYRESKGDNVGDTYQTIYYPELKALHVCIPSIDEQKRIVAALDQAFAALDRARANAEANLADAETVFDAWLTELFRERPSTWKTEKLNLLCDQITVGHVGPMADRYTTSGVPFLRSQNIRPFELSLVDVKSIDAQFHGELAKSALRPGDVAIVRTGYPGTAAAIPSSLPVSNCADLVIARPGERISPDFLVMFLNSSFGKTLVAEKSVGAAQKHFNVGAAKEAELPFPDRAEQTRLVLLAFERRDVTRALAEAYRTKLSDIAELRQSLLQAAFSGQLS
jgi:type I restriction enzyme S subunit